MKIIRTLAAAAAALAGASIASANDTAGGHWEWRSQPPFGPKSTSPARIRIWVKDADSSMANCDCAMMQADHAAWMMTMPGKAAAPSAGLGDCLADNDKQAGRARVAGEVFPSFAGARLPLTSWRTGRVLPIRRFPCD